MGHTHPWVAGFEVGGGARFPTRQVTVFADARWAILLSDHGNEDFRFPTFVLLTVGLSL